MRDGSGGAWDSSMPGGDCPNLIMVGEKRLKGPGEMVIPGDLINRLNDGHMSQ